MSLVYPSNSKMDKSKHIQTLTNNRKHSKYIQALTNYTIPLVLCEIIISYLNKYHLEIKYTSEGHNKDIKSKSSYYSWKGIYTQGICYFNIPALKFSFTMPRYGKIINFDHKGYTFHNLFDDVISYVDIGFGKILSDVGKGGKLDSKSINRSDRLDRSNTDRSNTNRSNTSNTNRSNTNRSNTNRDEKLNIENSRENYTYNDSLSNFIQELIKPTDYDIRSNNLGISRGSGVSRGVIVSSGLKYCSPRVMNTFRENIKEIYGTDIYSKIAFTLTTFKINFSIYSWLH